MGRGPGNPDKKLPGSNRYISQTEHSKKWKAENTEYISAYNKKRYQFKKILKEMNNYTSVYGGCVC